MDEFWLLHDKMFSKQRSLSVGLIKDMAKELGLEILRKTSVQSS